MNRESGFFASLFDLSFSELVTVKVIKFLFVLAIIIAAVASVGYIVASFAHSAGAGVLVLIISPIIFLIYVIMARIWLEVLIVIFRISEDVRRISDRQDDKS
ncbi:MAG: DUF4282 domain-containing protein [Candidatus Coatesbacteria bacterium]|nr:DUF4282 domain-containing protein [Candidatus Coatesbacteria bacterium]